MGAESSQLVDSGNGEYDPTKNYAKRSSRKLHRASFAYAIESWVRQRRKATKTKAAAKMRRSTVELRAEENSPSGGVERAKKIGKNVDTEDLPGQRPFSVSIRKRPLFPHEQESDFDVVDATGLLKENSLLVFDTRMKADMRGMKMTPNLFVVDKVFDEHASNEVVFDHAVSALADHVLDGHFASAFMFGQTGSGKTYTMSSMLRQAGNRIFERLELGPCVTVSISMFELYGTKCHDLLQQDATSSLDNEKEINTSNQEEDTMEDSMDESDVEPSAPRRQTLKVLEDADGSLQFNGLTEVVCGSTDDFIRELERASANRATSATGVHDQSSRSHAFTTIKLDFGNGEPGELLLVDLAGSERNKDSMTHDAQTQREGTEINKSLMALKDCFRAQAKGSSFVPFRASMLTRILKRALTDETAKTSLIATVSPSSGDTEHTLSTLNNISMMLSRPDGGTVSRKLKTEEVRSMASIEAEAAYKKAREADPKGWNKGQVKEWWARHAPPQIPAPSTTGVLLARWPEARFVQYCQDSLKRGSGASSAHSTPSLQPPNASQIGTALYTALRANVEDVRKQQLRRVMANRG
mmetsp:Transcript_11286/g.19916  ORF Transcript_11286/g.19916 Transcript_11286/m.19916 type:complete len:583 (+) Transcript_11286:195-1943(+)